MIQPRLAALKLIGLLTDYHSLKPDSGCPVTILIGVLRYTIHFDAPLHRATCQAQCELIYRLSSALTSWT